MNPVRIEIGEGDRIHIRSEFADKDKIKAMKGTRWSPDAKIWHGPLSMDLCRSLRRAFGERLQIGPELTTWARGQVAKEKRVAELGRAYDAELTLLPKVAPKLAERVAARTYQRSGAAFVAETRAALVADEVGLGKTTIALAGIVEAGNWEGQHLVVANKGPAMETAWHDEAVAFAGMDAYFMPDGKAKREALLRDFWKSEAPSKMLIVNKEMLRIKLTEWCAKCEAWFRDLEDERLANHYDAEHKTSKRIEKCEWPELFEIPWRSVTIDETHKTLSTGNKSATRKSQMAEGLTRLSYAPDAIRIGVTGTPFRGRERNLWGILNWLDPKRYSGFWGWAEQYLEVHDNGYGKEVHGLREDAREDFERMLNVHVLRRTRKEVRKDLPDRDRPQHWVSMSGEHARQYQEFALEGAARLENGSVESLGVLAELTRLRQFSYGAWKLETRKRFDKKLNKEVSYTKMVPTADSPKLRLVLEMLEDRGVTGDPKTEWRQEGGYKFIIASQFTEIVDSVEEELEKLGIATLKITGAVTGAKRTKAVRSFQEDPDGPRVLCMNMQAGGESITLDKYCDETFILDETFISDDSEQLEGRTDNRSVKVGEGRQRLFHYIRTKDTVEESIADLNMSQDEMQKKLLDSRRGIESAIRLVKRDG